jgi:hypothetical protein
MMKYFYRIIASLLFLAAVTVSAAESALPGDIVINEVASTGDFDFVELYNRTSDDLVLGPEWELADRKESRMDNDPRIQIPAGTVVPAGGYLLIAPYKTSGMAASVPEDIPDTALAFRSFAIGGNDEISLFYNGSLTDFITWSTAVNSIGRIPDGSEEVSSMLIPTPGAQNKAEARYQGAPVLLLNEVCSRGLDYVEIINVTFSSVTIGREEWRIDDSQKKDTVFLPEGTVIPPGGLLVIYPDVLRLPFSAGRNSVASSAGNRFGLGSNDTVYLRYNNLIADSFSWAEHVVSAGRYPDGSGDENWFMKTFLIPGKPNRK